MHHLMKHCVDQFEFMSSDNEKILPSSAASVPGSCTVSSSSASLASLENDFLI